MSIDQYYWYIQYSASYHGGALLQNVHSCDEHVLMWTLEQVSQQGDPPSVTDSLLVLGALAAASQCQQCTASHLHIPSFLCGQVGQVRDFLQYLDLRTETRGSFEQWTLERWVVGRHCEWIKCYYHGNFNSSHKGQRIQMGDFQELCGCCVYVSSVMEYCCH